MALAIVLAICVSVIVVTYMLCGVCKSEHDLEKVYEDISLLRVSVDRLIRSRKSMLTIFRVCLII